MNVYMYVFVFKAHVLYYAPNSHGIEGSLKRSKEIRYITWVRYVQVYADYTIRLGRHVASL